MKKWLILGMFLVAAPLLAENKAFTNKFYIEPKVGGMLPFSFPGGFIGGITLGRSIDEIVSLNFGFDWFNVAPNAATGASTNAWVSFTSVTNINYINLLLFSFNFRVDMPFLTLLQRITPYAQAGVDFNLMLNNYRSLSTGNNTYAFLGFGGLFEVGARLNLGSVTSLILAVAFNAADVVNGVSAVGVENRVIATGFLFRFGIGFRL